MKVDGAATATGQDEPVERPAEVLLPRRDADVHAPPHRADAAAAPDAAPAADAEPVPDVETAAENDAVIGRAAWWSLRIALVVGATAVALAFLMRRPPVQSTRKFTDLSAPILPPRVIAKIPPAVFTDVTAAAGIDFVHNSGAYGEKLLPETMGGGVAFFDYDGDGRQNLLFINSTYRPGHVPLGAAPTTLRLYHNDGHGRFTDVTAGSGLDVSLYGMGVAVGDYDNDGLPDVFVTGVGECRLFHNEGHGRFKDVTREAGLGASPDDWSTSAAFIDYDNDGKLDLFVCEYVPWSRDIDIISGYRVPGIGRVYAAPTGFHASYCRLYHNDGGGRFTDVSDKAGIRAGNKDTSQPRAKALGVAPVDLEGEGWLSLVVANDLTANFLFHNQRDGTFKEIGGESGVAFQSYGASRGSMGIDTARFRNDGALGIAIGTFAADATALYVTQGRSLLFADEALPAGVAAASRQPVKFGAIFFDYDLDGWEDLLTANGHVEPSIRTFEPEQTYLQPAQLFWNEGGAGRFIPVPDEKCGRDLHKPLAGRGAAFADMDGDGDLDVVLTQVGGPPLLLRNDQRLGHHWIRLKLVGTTCNRDAIGAQVRVSVGGRMLQRQVMPTRGYLSQSELPVTVGLGDTARPDRVEVIWPGGQRQEVPSVNVDAVTIITQLPAAR